MDKDKNSNDKKKYKNLNELEEEIDYKYNEKGELLHKVTGEKVGKLEKNEYELIGSYVEKYVENFLIQKFNMIPLYVPNEVSNDFSKRDETQAQCKILITQDFPTNPKCLIIIQGAGPVRLGQWARSICINDNLNIGTMGPYIENAIKSNMSVIIFNPNQKTDFMDDTKPIKKFPDHEKHSVYVYDKIVKSNKNIKEIYIVAHSVGGDCTLEILLSNLNDLLKGKIKKIAFTDTLHREEYQKLGTKGINIFRKISRNYVPSDKPLGEFVRDYNNFVGGINCYSSGHRRHEYTSGYAVEEIFKFFNLNEKDEKDGKKCQIF